VTELSQAALRRLVHARAAGCCEYCRTCDINTGQQMHIEHINPKSGDSADNLCLACPNCNLSKGTATSAIDDITGDVVALFNPRSQQWVEHFEWAEGGLFIRGKTATGRATVERLKMNQPRVVRARQNWILAGTHPPADQTPGE